MILHVWHSHLMDSTLRPVRWVLETSSRDSLDREPAKKVRVKQTLIF
jgi:hypothetical protein